MSRLLKILMIVGAIIAALTAALMMHGCATAGAVVKACAPATVDEQQAIVDLFSRPDLSTAEVIVAAEGGKIALCVVSEIARDVLKSASRIQTSSPLGAQSPLVVRAGVWLQAHP